MNTIELIVLVLKTGLFLTVVSAGLKVNSPDVLYLFRKPKLLGRSVLAMNLAMPIIAFVLAYFFKLAPVVKVALIAISVSPLAPLFPKKPVKAGGHNGYVIGLMLLTPVLSLVLIPVTLNLLSNLIQKPVVFSLYTIIVTLLVSVIVPLAFGMAMRFFVPATAIKIAPAVSKIGMLLLIVTVIPILYKLFPAVLQLLGNGTVLAFFIFAFSGILAGHYFGGHDQANRSVLALATATRHPAIAIVLASANFPGHHQVIVAVVLYLLVNALISITYIVLIRRNPDAGSLK